MSTLTAVTPSLNPKQLRFSLLLYLLLPLNSQLVELAHALPQRAPLTEGAEREAVLELWGSPSSKVQRETLREEDWIYPDALVTFRNGAVRRWQEGSGQNLSAGQLLQEAAALAGSVEPAKPTRQSAERLLDDILSELPNDTEGSSGSSIPGALAMPPPGLPGMPVIPPLPGAPIPLEPAELP
jgi:hypothetical protein